MNNNNIQEGSIDVRNEVVKVMSIVKEIIRGLYSKKYVKGGVINGGKEVKDDEFEKVLGYVNNEIKHRLEDSGVIGCPIGFVLYLQNSEYAGGYHPYEKIIVIDGYEYFTKFDKKLRVYVYLDFGKIRFDDMKRTIEHELIHQQQDQRSKGKFIKNKKNMITYDEVIELVSRKRMIAPEMDDELFMSKLMYFNDVDELDTYANNVADKYIQDKVKEMKDNIRRGIKSGDIEPINYSAEDVREKILGGIMRNKDNRYDISLKLQRELIKLSIGYKFLTVKNKKRYWKYLFKALLVNRFEPMIFVK